MRIGIMFLLLIIFQSCVNKKKKLILSPDQLESFYISIDPEKDYLFNTPKGALIRIKKGTFKEVVDLEIKEAYTITDMLLGGLTTESNGIPLYSGGMIYINEKNRNNVEVLQPIDIAMPTQFFDEQMQLYQGEELENSSINWVNPDSLPTTILSDQIAKGKALHQTFCSSCHSINRDMTGPAHREFYKRGNWSNPQELYKWVHNPAAYMSRNKYTQNLKAQFGSIMPAFPNLSNTDIDAIVAFIKNEENNPFDDTEWRVEEEGFNNNEADVPPSICTDTFYFYPEDTIPAAVVLEPVNTDFFDNVIPQQGLREPPLSLRSGFTDKPSSGAYEFQIQTLGWYNIDAEVKGLPGTELCELNVLVDSDIEDLIVYVFFPKLKDLSVGSVTDSGKYTFNKIDGKIPMYLGSEGVVLAFGSKGDNLYYGVTSFFAMHKQDVQVNIKPSSEEEFLNAIKKGKLEGINFELQKKKQRIVHYDCNANPQMADTIYSEFDYLQ